MWGVDVNCQSDDIMQTQQTDFLEKHQKYVQSHLNHFKCQNTYFVQLSQLRVSCAEVSEWSDFGVGVQLPVSAHVGLTSGFGVFWRATRGEL